MKIYLFKSNQLIVFGVRYNKDLYVDGEHQLTLSFWKWDLVFEWR